MPVEFGKVENECLAACSPFVVRGVAVRGDMTSLGTVIEAGDEDEDEDEVDEGASVV